MPILQIEATLQSSHLSHQYGIFGGKSQTSISRNATRAGSEEGRLFSQATVELTISVCIPAQDFKYLKTLLLLVEKLTGCYKIFEDPPNICCRSK